MYVILPSVILSATLKYGTSLLPIMIFTFALNCSIYSISLLYFKTNPDNRSLFSLCFAYYNIGLIGLPLSTLLFDEAALTCLLPAFIGGFLFACTVGIYVLQPKNTSPFQICRSFLSTPPLIALIAGMLWRFFDAPINMSRIDDFYQIAKQLLAIFGTMNMGMWLVCYPLKLKYSRRYLAFYSLKTITGLSILTVLWFAATQLGWLSIANTQYLFLIPFLPTAVSIVTLEAHYRGTGYSAELVAANTIISCVVIAIGYATYQIL
jgi:malate permease and related proteins